MLTIAGRQVRAVINCPFGGPRPSGLRIEVGNFSMLRTVLEKGGAAGLPVYLDEGAAIAGVLEFVPARSPKIPSYRTRRPAA